MKSTPGLAARLAAVGLAVLAAAGAWAAERYPVKPVRIVVPASPGGGLDIMARLMAQDLYAQWHQTVVADNRPGAGVMIGTELVSKSVPDGYTALVVNANIAPNAILQGKLGVIRQLSAVSLVAALPNALSISPALPAHSVKELIALAKSSKLSFASPGTGTLGHISGEMFRLAIGADMVHVPYKGGGPVMAAVASGEVPVGAVSLASTVPYMKAGRIRIIAVTGKKRSAIAPDIPTLSETVPGLEVDSWIGFLVPAGTPREVIDVFNRALQQSIARPDMQQKLAQQGFDAQGGTPQEFAATIESDVAKYSKVIAEAGIRGN